MVLGRLKVKVKVKVMGQVNAVGPTSIEGSFSYFFRILRNWAMPPRPAISVDQHITCIMHMEIRRDLGLFCTLHVYSYTKLKTQSTKLTNKLHFCTHIINLNFKYSLSHYRNNDININLKLQCLRSYTRCTDKCCI